jgi:hypothetical protein
MHMQKEKETDTQPRNVVSVHETEIPRPLTHIKSDANWRIGLDNTIRRIEGLFHSLSNSAQ